MLSTIIHSLVPVAFVILLGFIAGYKKIINNQHSHSLATYVMSFSFPCLLFAITATASPKLLINIDAIVAFTIGLMGMYLIGFAMHHYIMRRDIHKSAQGAFVCAFPDMAFMGIPIFMQLLGPQALISIVMGNIITSVLMIPMTVTLLELKHGNSHKLHHLIAKQLFTVIKKPLVFAPVLGIIYSISGLELPKLIDDSLHLIGNTTSGVSLFALGLIMSCYTIKLTRGVLLNIMLKNIIHPVLMIALVAIFALKGIFAKEVILLCAMPTATMTTMFALKYQTLTEESTSATILGTLISIITLPVFMLIVAI
ncbi:MAG: AEC family transporter [Francisellaceae bacterium]